MGYALSAFDIKNRMSATRLFGRGILEAFYQRQRQDPSLSSSGWSQDYNKITTRLQTPLSKRSVGAYREQGWKSVWMDDALTAEISGMFN